MIDKEKQLEILNRTVSDEKIRELLTRRLTEPTAAEVAEAKKFFAALTDSEKRYLERIESIRQGELVDRPKRERAKDLGEFFPTTDPFEDRSESSKLVESARRALSDLRLMPRSLSAKELKARDKERASIRGQVQRTARAQTKRRNRNDKYRDNLAPERKELDRLKNNLRNAERRLAEFEQKVKEDEEVLAKPIGTVHPDRRARAETYLEPTREKIAKARETVQKWRDALAAHPLANSDQQSTE